MILNNDLLIAYYPTIPNVRIESYKGHLVFLFKEIEKVEIYDKITFELIFESSDPIEYYYLNCFPSLANISGSENLKVYNGHIRNGDQGILNSNSYLCTYGFKKNKLEPIVESDSSFSGQIVKEKNYREFFDFLNPELKRKTFLEECSIHLNTLRNKYEIDLKDSFKSFMIGEKNEPVIDIYIDDGTQIYLKNKMICLIRYKSEENLGRGVIAYDYLMKKVIWYFSLPSISVSAQQSMLQIRLNEEEGSSGNQTSFHYPRFYNDAMYVHRDILVFNWNSTLYGLNVIDGNIAWRKENTMDFPLLFDGKGYVLNVLEAFKIIDLENGKELFCIDSWIVDESPWLKMTSSGANLKNQNEDIKIYHKHIVAYDFWSGIFYFFNRINGELLFELDISEVAYSYEIEEGKLTSEKLEEQKRKGNVIYGFKWEIHKDHLFIGLPYRYCVYKIIFEDKVGNFTPKLITGETGILAMKSTDIIDAQRPNESYELDNKSSMDDVNQLKLDF